MNNKSYVKGYIICASLALFVFFVFNIVVYRTSTYRANSIYDTEMMEYKKYLSIRNDFTRNVFGHHVEVIETRNGLYFYDERYVPLWALSYKPLRKTPPLKLYQ